MKLYFLNAEMGEVAQEGYVEATVYPTCFMFPHKIAGRDFIHKGELNKVIESKSLIIAENKEIAKEKMLEFLKNQVEIENKRHDILLDWLKKDIEEVEKL